MYSQFVKEIQKSVSADNEIHLFHVISIKNIQRILTFYMVNYMSEKYMKPQPPSSLSKQIKFAFVLFKPTEM